MLQQFFKDYFSYSKKERTGIIVLLFIIVFTAILPFTYPLFIHPTPPAKLDFKNAIQALNIKADTSRSRYYKYNSTIENDNNEEDTPAENPVVFEFDPNTASAAEWKQLGIKDKTIHTIQNYLSKGGHFYKAQDIGKIWGLDKKDADRLIPYVKIAGSEKKENNYSTPVINQPAITHSYSKENAKPIDINLADSSSWVSLPGIGASYSRRIINFRNRLGGFYAIEQVGETFGLPDSVFQKIKPKLLLADTAVRKININTAAIDELKSHPYIRFYIANAIVQYRTQHGNFSSLKDLKKIMVINQDAYNKMYHYLSL